ncbi:hypothetical protein [Capnocytophaga cynodegmi]|uniref:hypothetical protein n=1 Tax=Capnocytophaga cynodegmi TaxID=28189 RepID=UPI00385F8BF8
MKRIVFLMFLVLGIVGCSSVPEQGYFKKDAAGTITEAHFDEMIDNSVKKDANAFGRMVLEGKIFIVKEGTEFKVIESKTGMSKCKVKVNGIERELWITNESLKN